MPKFTVVCRGGLRTKDGLIPTGDTVEMSKADADSLPPGTVERGVVDVEPEVPTTPPEPEDIKATGKKGHR